MTLYQYKALQESEQATILWDEGVHLGERFDTEHKVLLYQIDGFYVVVFYNEGDNAIERLISFETVDRLMPYLDMIEITLLLQ
jgi:hypothetical protein